MDADLDLLTAGLERQPGASEEALCRVEQLLGVRFPDDYRAFIRASNGARGWINGVYLQFWRIEDIPMLMEAGLIRERVPGLVPFGDDGSRENLVFDVSKNPPPVALADITCGSRDDVLVRAKSLLEFLHVIRQTGDLFPPDL
jgi:hypothetical protein